MQIERRAESERAVQIMIAVEIQVIAQPDQEIRGAPELLGHCGCGGRPAGRDGARTTRSAGAATHAGTPTGVAGAATSSARAGCAAICRRARAALRCG